LTNEEVHEELIVWLAGLLDLKVIKDRQGVERPALPYGMVDLANWRNLHEHVDDIRFSGTDVVTATPDLEIEWVFLFFVYGAQGENLVRRLQSAVHLAQLQEPLRPRLTIHEVSSANSIPELVGEKWEPRSQVNIVVRGKSSDGFIVDVIEEHDFTLTGERA
jgi:hypothetical protein